MNIPKLAIYPGTFDPLTLGHMDIIKRASRLFDKVIVAIASSARKSPIFSLEKRIYLARLVIGDQLNVEVHSFGGLLVDFATQLKANVIIRGLRAITDFEYEFQLAGMNRKMAPDIETLFMTPSEQFTFLSARIIREIAELGGDVSDFVHPEVKQALYEKYGRVECGVNDH
jgi:pantetheine-phosphate adenylyltransferase